MRELLAESDVVASIALVDGLGRPCSMVVHRHLASGRWVLELPYRVFGEPVPAALRAFASDVLVAVGWRPTHGHRWREVDHGLFDDAQTRTEVTVGATKDGPYLLVVAYLTPEHAGTDASGEPVFYHPLGAAYLELTADPADAGALATAARAILDGLGSAR